VSETPLAGIEDHIEQAISKVTDLATIHLPEIAAWLQKVRANPLVTAFRAVIPNDISDDTMAVLNGLAPILVALGAKGIQGTQAAAPAPAAAPASPAVGIDTSTAAAAAPVTVTPMPGGAGTTSGAAAGDA
jgi:hypothetical protein